MLTLFKIIQEKMNQHKIKFFQIDAFTQSTFNGNPAAVCPLDSWLDDDTLQKLLKKIIFPKLHFL